MAQYNKKILYITDQFQISELSSKNQEIKFRKRNLPHWEMPGACYFITFRLADSIPISVIEQLREENERKINNEIQRLGKMNKYRLNELKFEMVMKIDDYLDKNINIRYLSYPRIAKIVQDALLYFAVLYVPDTNDFANKSNVKIFHVDNYQGDIVFRYILFRWAIIPNHVHVQILPMINHQTGKYFELEKILHSIKSYAANEANKILNRERQFWQHESYDHIIRNEEEFYRIWRYIDYNPVKARLCQRVEDWEWSAEYFVRNL